jgi:hypothetical protein
MQDDDDDGVQVTYPEIGDAIENLVDAVRRHWPGLDERALFEYIADIVRQEVRSEERYRSGVLGSRRRNANQITELSLK